MTSNKKYKILLTNHALRRQGGTETYIFYLSKTLAKQHDVYIYSTQFGKMSDRMSEHATIISKSEGDFDIILFNHNTTVDVNFEARCKIFTIHGIFNKLEHAPLGMDAYVCISQEIIDQNKELDPTLIHNGIETQAFKPAKRQSFRKHLLYSSNYKNNFSRILWFVALSLGMGYRRIGRKKAKFNIIDDLNWADVVVGVGRTALEAMSMNRKVIICDKRSYANYGMDGFVSKENVEKVSYYNYSGRAMKKPINFFSVRQEIKQALKSNSEWSRDWIIKQHNIENSAAAYIQLAEKIINKKNQ